MFSVLNATEHTGCELTESFAVHPGASVSGLYFNHPQARYFGISTDLGKDQIEDIFYSVTGTANTSTNAKIQVDCGSGWAVRTFDTTRCYADSTPFPATPTKWKYRAIYRAWTTSKSANGARR